MNTIKVIAITFFSILLIGCLEEKWEGFVYPNAKNLTISRNIGVFSSLEECRDVALSTLSSINSVHAGDYECGLNCDTNNNLEGLNICEKTMR